MKRNEKFLAKFDYKISSTHRQCGDLPGPDTWRAQNPNFFSSTLPRARKNPSRAPTDDEVDKNRYRQDRNAMGEKSPRNARDSRSRVDGGMTRRVDPASTRIWQCAAQGPLIGRPRGACAERALLPQWCSRPLARRIPRGGIIRGVDL